LSAPVLSWLFSVPQPCPKTETQPHRAQKQASYRYQSPVRSRCPARPCPETLNPQSQSLSRGYGSILPTSLIYIILSTRGCTPWRPEAVMSTTRGANKSRHRGFKGRRERTGQAKKSLLCPSVHCIAGQSDSTVHFWLRRRENSSRSPRQRSRFRLCCHSISTSWYRNLNLFPFRWPAPS